MNVTSLIVKIVGLRKASNIGKGNARDTHVHEKFPVPIVIVPTSIPRELIVTEHTWAHQ